jgi:ribonuclease T1
LKGLVVRWVGSKLALSGILLLLGLACSGLQAKNQNETANLVQVTSVALGSLPQQGIETYQRIRQGGPFEFEKDGVVFGNRERLLPLQKRGYYREYTVKTPGARNRGARRLVCGGEATTPDACYYTADHYASFRKVVP